MRVHVSVRRTKERWNGPTTYKCVHVLFYITIAFLKCGSLHMPTVYSSTHKKGPRRKSQQIQVVDSRVLWEYNSMSDIQHINKMGRTDLAHIRLSMVHYRVERPCRGHNSHTVHRPYKHTIHSPHSWTIRRTKPHLITTGC